MSEQRELKQGERKVMNRPTFLHNGIFVLQGSSVTVQKQEGENVTVEWTDREGNPHLLSNIRPEELS